MATTDHTLIADILTLLKVPYTADYTKQRFEAMPFQTLFGVTQLLKEYGVDSKGYRLAQKSDISKITAPFIAQTDGGLVIVTNIAADKVSYLTQGVSESMPLSEFLDAFTGVVLIVKAEAGAEEPDYGAHRMKLYIKKGKNWLMWILAGLLVAYLLVVNGTWRFWSVWALIGIDCCGLALTYMLLQKSLSIKNKVADKVCGVLQEGGCDSILKMKASSFFGIFSWSEVGFTYFGVSLLTLLISPSSIHWLALINICCLPFTMWSIWYQKFRAHHWCTLCVSVQLSLWLLFICYLLGGWTAPVFPLKLDFWVLGVLYLCVLLLLNKVLPHFSNKNE